jgi:lipopolysaccharide/colanic/teichoic acid biosynthesis glycosyltransferase
MNPGLNATQVVRVPHVVTDHWEGTERAEIRVVSPAVDFSPADRLTGRRVLNVVVAVIGLIVLSPLMLVIAILVRLTSPGPVIYKQTRVGVDRRRPRSNAGSGRRKVDYGGRLFTIYKFRTMRAEPGAVLEIWATPGDHRVTRLGNLLRKYRLDEIPQLFNVIRGDMNIVGPRPEQPKIFANLCGAIAEYPLRQRVLPGITGLAQVNHHYDRCLEDVRTKIRYDLEYIRHESVASDLRILLQTFPTIIFRRGAW